MAQEILFNNNARSTLLAGISAGDTVLSVAAGHGARFDSPGAGQIFKGTLFNDAGNREIVHVSARSGDTMSTVLRAQEGTTALAWNAGDGFSQNLTAGALDQLSQLDRAETYTAAKTFNAVTALPGGVSGVTSFTSGIGPDYKQNIGLLATVAAKALTVAFKTKALADPSAVSPSELAFRNATLTVGDYVIGSLAAAASVVAPSGATLGFTASQTGYLYVYALLNGSTVEPIITGSNHWDEATVQSTTAIGTGSDSGSVLYSTTSRSNVPIRYVGRIKIQTGAVAGEWDNEDTEVSVGQLFKPRSPELLASGTVAAAPTLDIPIEIYYSMFKTFKLICDGFLPASDDVEFALRHSTDGGSTFASAAASYNWVTYNVGVVTAGIGTGAPDSIVRLNGRTAGSTLAVGNGANEGVSAEITIYNAESNSLSTRFTSTANVRAATTDEVQLCTTAGSVQTAGDSTDIRIMFSSGNIASGNWSLFGYP
jgi:hypothetical protein